MNTELHFATGNDIRQTPPEVFDPLFEEFQFAIDLAALVKTRRLIEFFGPDHPIEDYRDALTIPWHNHRGPGWCNPPYSRGLQGQFIAKASREAKKGFVTVMLLPARPDTVAFHAYIYDKRTHAWRPGVEVRFIQGRIGFLDEDGNPILDKNGSQTKAPFPSMIVIFRKPPTPEETDVCRQ